MLTYADLEDRICQWALARADIRAIIMVGSRAREQHPADTFSDLDLILLSTDTSLYQTDRSWLDAFGTVLLATVDTLDNGAPEWIAVYEGIVKGDFTFAQSTNADSLAGQLVNFPFQNVLARGLRVLVDKYPNSKPLTLSPRLFRMPTSTQYEQVVANFWVVATRVAKFIQRGDLWRAVTMLYCKMRFYLVTMLEWHAHVLHGVVYDTWYDGRFLDDWLDAETLASLPDLFAHYEAAELRLALHNMVILFRRLARVVAQYLGYAYPESADAQLTAWLQML
jgi:aminoglycoside 6-adenylyltransferase